MNLYSIIPAEAEEVPILIHSPHSGTAVPDDIRKQLREGVTDFIDDTDFFLPEIYASFAPALGINIMHANYSRWVVDLNRDPESRPLYTDGRHITGLCTATDFLGNSLYKPGFEPGEEEISRRKKIYYEPYYLALRAELDRLKEKFGFVLLYDAHSIRSVVPSIQNDRFPDMILGTADGSSASTDIMDFARAYLASGSYGLSYNHPFKGGHITRHFGKPDEGVHALQLERCKDLYMSESETQRDQEKMQFMADFLSGFFRGLIDVLAGKQENR